MSRNSAATPLRLPMIDTARGFALVAMIVYHASWNLEVFGFVDWGVYTHPVWLWFARLIAGSFLFLVGISLTLAHAQNKPLVDHLRRIAIVALGALAVSIVTYVLFGENFVYFGILHHIALASLIALPFLRSSVWTQAGSAVLIVLAWQTLSFDVGSRWIAWIGVSGAPPAAHDYVPLLPWLAVVFVGMICGRLLLNHAPHINASHTPQHGFTKGVRWTGTHSLLIYLIHQPILFGAAYAAFWLINH